MPCNILIEMSESSHSLGKGIWLQLSICLPTVAQREALLGTQSSQQLLPLCNSKCSTASLWLFAAEKRKERKSVAGYSAAQQPDGLCLSLLMHLENNDSPIPDSCPRPSRANCSNSPSLTGCSNGYQLATGLKGLHTIQVRTHEVQQALITIFPCPNMSPLTITHCHKMCKEV